MNTSSSIISSIYNKKQTTIDIIDSLFFPSLLNNASSDRECVILDDCSPLKKETKTLVNKYLFDLRRKFGNVIFERNSKNLGFAGSFNKGIELASGENLIITNSDIYFPQGSINSLISVLSRNLDYGIVGPITSESGTWTYQYCKQGPKIKNYSQRELVKIEKFAKLIENLMKGETIQTDLVSGFCFAIRKNTIQELGPFDESFEYGLFEDIDFVRRVVQKFKVVITPFVYVHHGGIKGSSSSIFQHPLKCIYSFFINAYKYGKKWSDHKGTIKFILRGFYRWSGRDTVSELIEKKMKKYSN